MKIRCVFVDLDGTLISNPSSEKRFFWYLLKNKIIGWRNLLAWLKFLICYYPQFGTRVLQQNKAYLANLNEAEIKKAAQDFFGCKLKLLIDQRIFKQLNTYKNEGARLVLLTGAPHFIAELFYSYLHFDDVIASSLAISDGKFQALPPIQVPFDKNKLILAGEYCQQNQFSIAECTAFADSIHDVFLLEAVHEAIVVNPSKKMRQLAEKRNWKII